jgi:hypothetical protein
VGSQDPFSKNTHKNQNHQAISPYDQKRKGSFTTGSQAPSSTTAFSTCQSITKSGVGAYSPESQNH